MQCCGMSDVFNPRTSVILAEHAGTQDRRHPCLQEAFFIIVVKTMVSWLVSRVSLMLHAVQTVPGLLQCCDYSLMNLKLKT